MGGYAYAVGNPVSESDPTGLSVPGQSTPRIIFTYKARYASWFVLPSPSKVTQQYSRSPVGPRPLNKYGRPDVARLVGGMFLCVGGVTFIVVLIGEIIFLVR
jgi:hypothetical protein